MKSGDTPSIVDLMFFYRRVALRCLMSSNWDVCRWGMSMLDMSFPVAIVLSMEEVLYG